MAASKPQACSEFGDTGVLLKEAREAPQDIKMAIYTYGQLIPSLGDAKFRPMISEIIEKQLEYYKKPTLNIYGTLYFGTTSAMSGLVANIIFRNSFKVQHEALKTCVYLTTLPFLATIITYKLFVTDALHSGNLSKENCIMRSVLIGVGCGILYPSALAFRKNGHLAVKYHSVPLPPKGRVILHWLILSQTGMKLMSAPLVFQAVFGVIHGSHHHALCEKLLGKKCA
ncbi:complex I assembly factor TMEM126B, mitochondrial [Cricetulus griseus]|uniref:Complex I assembly factor TMEM126B, mitochondrial n=1 Tax=Cricetulus griseus TaxID=10029 RepID=G3HXR1_CRIGR|nr:complex I assembly factor TMEM126B, mitochondrial [Cricetulus griseus]XP_027263443.1 complex I assembly factor TMEM126B, mitochondrial [Cricetulus griseus]EGW05894.1 Transmembrane protein 126B [Cricetulus griseus]